MGDDVRVDREIVDDILKELREAGAKVSDTRIAERRIKQLIEDLRALRRHGPPKGNRNLNREHTEKIISLIGALEQALANHPKNYPLNYLFTPPVLSLLADPEAVDNQKAEQRRYLFAAFLADVQERGNRIIEQKVGEHGLSGYQQKRAARASRELLEPFQIRLHYTSPTSAYRTIASLFFEAMTGTYGADLERACEAMVSGQSDFLGTEALHCVFQEAAEAWSTLEARHRALQEAIEALSMLIATEK
jgi:hypothetical protein